MRCRESGQRCRRARRNQAASAPLRAAFPQSYPQLRWTISKSAAESTNLAASRSKLLQDLRANVAADRSSDDKARSLAVAVETPQHSGLGGRSTTQVERPLAPGTLGARAARAARGGRAWSGPGGADSAASAGELQASQPRCCDALPPLSPALVRAGRLRRRLLPARPRRGGAGGAAARAAQARRRRSSPTACAGCDRRLQRATPADAGAPPRRRR